jgi:SagB-type dehydrogenase family enzyme
MDFSMLFHQSSKDYASGVQPPFFGPESQWPPEWTTTYYKRYPGLKHIKLLSVPPQADFFELVEHRRSDRDFGKMPMTIENMSTLLKYSCGIVNEATGSRAQPSGGARYPIEVYTFVFKGSEDLPAGIYHYDVKAHMLDVLLQKQFTNEEIAEIISYDFAQEASCAIIMTGVFNRNQMKYGERGYRYILLEAGHIGQNLYLAAASLGFKCCALGGTRDIAIENMFEIDGIGESVVYGLVLG